MVPVVLSEEGEMHQEVVADPLSNDENEEPMDALTLDVKSEEKENIEEKMNGQ